jgi:hypothetical protein
VITRDIRTAQINCHSAKLDFIQLSGLGFGSGLGQGFGFGFQQGILQRHGAYLQHSHEGKGDGGLLEAGTGILGLDSSHVETI